MAFFVYPCMGKPQSNARGMSSPVGVGIPGSRVIAGSGFDEILTTNRIWRNEMPIKNKNPLDFSRGVWWS